SSLAVPFSPSFPTRRSSDLVEQCLAIVALAVHLLDPGFPHRRRAGICELLSLLGRDDHLLQPRLLKDLRRLRLFNLVSRDLEGVDRKSTRLNSSHVKISYAV